MNILLFSDSHGDTDPMLRLIRLHKPDTVLHLGDHDRDLRALQEQFPDLRCLGVRGNCDGPGSPEQLLLEEAGVRMLLTHGHRQQVKMSLLRLMYLGLEEGVQLCLFGHTHRPHLEEVQGLCLLNPGAVAAGSYALLTLENGSFRAVHHRV